MDEVRPRLLDLFCGAGGAAMGYHRAGFEVVGVDIKPQPHYPFEFHQADGRDFCAQYGREFHALHASPPCQPFVSLRWMHNAKGHDDLIPAFRAVLQETKRPFVIENVVGAPLRHARLLCGTFFGLGVKEPFAELRRHRIFEINPVSLFWLEPQCLHGQAPRVISVHGGHGKDKRRTVNGQDFPTSARREAMGIDWMTGTELNQAIPPAYTEFIGRQLKRACDAI